MRRLAWRSAIGALALASVATVAAAESGLSLDYLYIEANEGGSSGGHVAVGLGSEVFHFEHRAPGVLILGVDDLDRFRYHYGVRENRTIHATRIPVSEETHRLLVDHFRDRLFLQTRHLDVMESLRADRVTLEQMLSGAIDVEAAGVFSTGETATTAPRPDPDLMRLRIRVEEAHGNDVLDRRAAIVRGTLAALGPQAMELPEPPADDLPPAPSYTYPQRYRDAITALAALDTLAEARPLARGVLTGGGIDALVFAEADAEAARHLSEAVTAALVRLVASERPDAGVALLVGMARLVALEESRRQGRWLMVDAFGAVGSSPLPVGAALEADLRAAGAAVARERERLVARVGDSRFPEADFAAFEAAVNRLAELHAAVAEGRQPRVRPASTVRWRPARRSVSGLYRAALLDGLEAVRRREEDYATGFKRRWEYNLVTRNCVSEIFREIDAAFAGGGEESRARLGGRMDAAAGLSFVPAVSATAVARAYPVTERLEIPSYRRWRTAQMYERENPLVVFLRESNTVTSTLYRRNADDSIFVFFTDDAVAARPLLGIVNLAVGLAAGAVGLLTLPVDGGAVLWNGLRGAVFSLPELFFQNIRKGSFGHVNVDVRPPALVRQAGARGG